MEGVSFNKEIIDCSTFIIKRFSAEELSELVNNNVNDLFYHQAVWDVDRFSMYWFLEVEGEEDVNPPGTITLDFTDLYYLRRKLVPDEFSPFKPILYRC